MKYTLQKIYSVINLKRLIFTLVMVIIFIALGMYAARALFNKTDRVPGGGTMVYYVNCNLML